MWTRVAGEAVTWRRITIDNASNVEPRANGVRALVGAPRHIRGMRECPLEQSVARTVREKAVQKNIYQLRACLRGIAHVFEETGVHKIPLGRK